LSNNAASFVGDIPSHYDSGLGPNIFVDYADLIVQQCQAHSPQSVVELAAGTGIVSKRLRDALPQETRLVVTDLNGPMLDIAKTKFADTDNVEFMVANAMDLPFAESEFDLMTCQFGVMFFPDKPVSYREAARVLKPGGRYIFNVWGAMASNPFARLANEVTASFFPTDPPGFYKVPFHYHDPLVVKADLAAAGWNQVAHDTICLTKTVADPQAFATALVFGNPLIDEIRARGGVEPDDVVAAMLESMHSEFGQGQFEMPLEATTYICEVSK